MSAPDQRMTGLVLAGGRATRMGGEDKGLLEVAGRPMIAYVIDALRPQVARILVNANRNTERYARFGVPVLGDRLAGFQGPLAGMASGMAAADTEFVLTVPCDSPLVPDDLAGRLIDALEASGALIAVAHDGRRQQPVFALLRTELLSDLKEYLASGERKIDRWFRLHRIVEADFSDRTQAFLNVNTPADRAVLENILGER